MQDGSFQDDERAVLVDRLRHALQYAEAARLMVEEALALLEAPKGEDDDDADVQ
jgi:hypothetical protein